MYMPEIRVLWNLGINFQIKGRKEGREEGKEGKREREKERERASQREPAGVCWREQAHVHLASP